MSARAEASADVAELSAKLARAEKMIIYRNEKIAGMKAEALTVAASMEEAMAEERATEVARASCASQELEEIKDIASERLATIRRMAGEVGGRPVISRGADALEECSASAAYSCAERMTERMLSAVGVRGEQGAISDDALMDGLVEGGWMEVVWESRQCWESRMAWVDELKELLQLVWTPDLTRQIRDNLSVSYDKLDELRFSLSHNRVGKQLRPRPWVINPWTGKRENFPQPIAPRNGPRGWAHLIKVLQEKWGLRMDATGRVAQRSFSEAVTKQVLRDEARCHLRPPVYC